MTHTSPLPPSEHPAGAPHSITVSSVMFGQGFLDGAGNPATATADGVVLYLHGGEGEVIATRFQTAEGAIELALAIQSCAVLAFKGSVDDAGKPPSISERLSRLSAAYSRVGR